MRRIPLAVALAAIFMGTMGVLQPAPALANNDPHRVFLPAGPLDLPAGFCAFPTHFDVVANKEYGRVTTLPDGTTVIVATGSFKLSATNVESGKTILVNASGPGTVTLYPDGSGTVDGTGHWLVTNLADQAARFGLPALMLTSGRLHEAIDFNTLTLSELSVTGHVTDVCAALA